MFGSLISGAIALGKSIMGKIGLVDSVVDLGKAAVQKQSAKWLGIDMARGMGTAAAPVAAAATSAVRNIPKSVGNLRDLLVPRNISGSGPRVTWGEFAGASAGIAGAAGLSAAERSIPYGGPSASYGGGTGVLRPLLTMASNNVGAPVTTKKVVSTIRQFGFERASQFFGLNVDQLSYIWLRGTKRTKTRFTSNDKRRARGYIRHLKRCEAELSSLRPRARRTYRRRSTK